MMPMGRWARWHWIAVLCCLVCFCATTLIADQVFERVAHLEDEVAYLFQAQVFAVGQTHADSPSQPACFFAPFVLDHQGRRFGKYSPGWPALLALGVVFGRPWWVNPCLATVTIALIFRLTTDLHSARCGSLAAGLAITSPFLLILSGSIMSHPSCLAFLTAFYWLFYRSRARQSCCWALASGMAWGMAFLIRPFTALAVAVPVALDLGWRALRYREWRVAWILVLGAVPFCLLLPVTNAIWTGDPLLSPYVLFWPYDRLGFGPGHGTLPEGNTLWLGLGSAAVSVGHLANHLLGWPGLSLAFVGLLFLFPPRRHWDLVLLGAEVSLTLGYVAYWTNGDVFGPRYVYEGSFALFCLTAAGIDRVAVSLSRRGRRGLGVAILALIGINLLVYLPHQLEEYHALYGITAPPQRLLEASQLDNALVIVRDDGGWKDYAGAFSLNDPNLDGEVVFASECPSWTDQLLAFFSGREVYYFDGSRLYAWSDWLALNGE